MSSGYPSSSSQSSWADGTVVSSAIKLQNNLMRNVLDKLFSCSPGLGVNVGHHKMECAIALCTDLIECVDMPLVHIKIGICRKFRSLLDTGTPLTQGCIELLELAIWYWMIWPKQTYRCCHQGNHWNRYFMHRHPIRASIGWEEVIVFTGEWIGTSFEVEVLDCLDDLVVPIGFGTHWRSHGLNIC